MSRRFSVLQGASLLAGLTIGAWPQVAISQEPTRIICQSPQGTRQVTEQQVDACNKIIGFQVEQGRTINRYDIGLGLDEEIEYISELGIPLKDPNTDRFTRFARSIDPNDDEFVVPTNSPGTNMRADYIVFRTPDEHQRIRFEGLDVERVSANTYRVRMDDVLSTYRALMPDRDVFEVQGEMYRADCNCPSTLGVKLLVSDLPERIVERTVEVLVERIVQVPIERIVEVPVERIVYKMPPKDSSLQAGIGVGVKMSSLQYNQPDVCLNGNGLAAMGQASYQSEDAIFAANGNMSIGMKGCDPRNERNPVDMSTMDLQAHALFGDGLMYGGFLNATRVSASGDARSLAALGGLLGATRGPVFFGAGPMLGYTNQEFSGGAGMVANISGKDFGATGQVFQLLRAGAGASVTAHVTPFKIGDFGIGVHAGLSRYVLCEPEQDNWHNDSAFIGVSIRAW